MCTVVHADDDNLVTLSPIENCSAIPRGFINASIIDVSISSCTAHNIFEYSSYFRDTILKRNTLLLKV